MDSLAGANGMLRHEDEVDAAAVDEEEESLSGSDPDDSDYADPSKSEHEDKKDEEALGQRQKKQKTTSQTKTKVKAKATAKAKTKAKAKGKGKANKKSNAPSSGAAAAGIYMIGEKDNQGMIDRKTKRALEATYPPALLPLLRAPDCAERRVRWLDARPMVAPLDEKQALEYHRNRHGNNVVHKCNVGLGWVNHATWGNASATRELIQNFLDATRDAALEISGIKRIEWHHLPMATSEERRILAVGIPMDGAPGPAHVLLGSITWERILPPAPAAAAAAAAPAAAFAAASAAAAAAAAGAAASDSPDVKQLPPCVAAHGTLAFVADTCTCEWRLVLENEAVRLNDGIMCVGRTSKKDQPRRSEYAANTEIDGPIGHFGEGLKMALLVLCSNKARTRICTNTLWWSFSLSREEELVQEKVLNSNNCVRQYMKSYQNTSVGASVVNMFPRQDCLRVIVDRLRGRDVLWSHFIDLHPVQQPKLWIHRNSRLDGAELLIDRAEEVGACYHRGIWVERVKYLPFGVNLLGDVELNRDRERLPREFVDAGSFLRTTLGRLCDLEDFHVDAFKTATTLPALLYDVLLGDKKRSEAHTLLVQAARQHSTYKSDDGTKLGSLAMLLWNEAKRRAGRSDEPTRIFPLFASDGAAANNEKDEQGTLYSHESSLRLLHEARLYDAARPWKEQCLEVPPLLYHMCCTSNIMADMHAARKAFRTDMFRDTPLMMADAVGARPPGFAATLVSIDAKLSSAIGRSVHVVVHDVEPLRATVAGRDRLHDENLSIMRLREEKKAQEEKKDENEEEEDERKGMDKDDDVNRGDKGRCVTVELLSPILLERDWFHRIHGQGKSCDGGVDGEADDAQTPCSCVVIFIVEFLVDRLNISWRDFGKRNLQLIDAPRCDCGITNKRMSAAVAAAAAAAAAVSKAIPLVVVPSAAEAAAVAAAGAAAAASARSAVSVGDGDVDMERRDMQSDLHKDKNDSGAPAVAAAAVAAAAASIAGEAEVEDTDNESDNGNSSAGLDMYASAAAAAPAVKHKRNRKRRAEASGDAKDDDDVADDAEVVVDVDGEAAAPSAKRVRRQPSTTCNDALNHIRSCEHCAQQARRL